MNEIPKFYYVIPAIGIVVVFALLFLPTQADDVYFLNNGAGGGGITSLTTSTPLVTNATTGDILISCPTCVTNTTTFVFLCSDTASNGDTSMSCTVPITKKYYLVTALATTQTSTISMGIQFNGDTGNSYSNRYAPIFTGAGTTNTGATIGAISAVHGAGKPQHIEFTVFNPLASVEKAWLGQMIALESDDLSLSNNYDFQGMWDNSANSISTITLARASGTGTLTSNSYMVVYGYD